MERVENEQKMGNRTVLCSHMVVLLTWCRRGAAGIGSRSGALMVVVASQLSTFLSLKS